MILEYLSHDKADLLEMCCVKLGMNIVRVRENKRGPHEFDVAFFENWYKDNYATFRTTN